MKTTELYLAILEEIRYKDMNVRESATLEDFEEDSKGYFLMNRFNEIALKLSSLIDVMTKEIELSKDCKK